MISYNENEIIINSIKNKNVEEFSNLLVNIINNNDNNNNDNNNNINEALKFLKQSINYLEKKSNTNNIININEVNILYL